MALDYTFTELFKPYTNVGPTPALPTKERAGDTQLLGFGSLGLMDYAKVVIFEFWIS